MRALEIPSESIIKTLYQEMEELIIETNIKKDSGPLRSAWENALRKYYRTSGGKKKEKNFWEVDVSDEESDEGEQAAETSSSAVLDPLPGIGPRDLGLLTPRAGPQNQTMKRPSYARARSLSF